MQISMQKHRGSPDVNASPCFLCHISAFVLEPCATATECIESEPNELRDWSFPVHIHEQTANAAYGILYGCKLLPSNENHWVINGQALSAKRVRVRDRMREWLAVTGKDSVTVILSRVKGADDRWYEGVGWGRGHNLENHLNNGVANFHEGCKKFSGALLNVH